MTDTPPPTLLTGRQVAELLNVHACTVRRWRASGRLRFVELAPNVFRYRLVDVDELMGNTRKVVSERGQDMWAVFKSQRRMDRLRARRTNQLR